MQKIQEAKTASEFHKILLKEGWSIAHPIGGLESWQLGAHRNFRQGKYQIPVCIHIYNGLNPWAIELQCTLRLNKSQGSESWMRILHYGLPHKPSKTMLSRHIRALLKAARAALEEGEKTP
jgi:hypothetical protein